MFTTFLASLLRAVLALRCRQANVPSSVDRVLRGFAPLYATDQTFVDGSRLTQLGELSGFQQRVLTRSGGDGRWAAEPTLAHLDHESGFAWDLPRLANPGQEYPQRRLFATQADRVRRLTTGLSGRER